MDFDTALKGAGDFGLYQKLIIFLLVVPSGALCALVYLCQYFILLIPDDYFCYMPDIEYNNTTVLTVLKHKHLFIPRDSTSDTNYSRCEMYNVDVASLLMNGTTEPNPAWNRTKCQHGWYYDYQDLYPTFATELNMVCDRNDFSYYVQLVFYIGTSVGSVIFGFIADHFGRKPSIVLSFGIACVAGFASSFIKDLYIFSILRFFVGACIIPLSEDPYVLSLEYIGAHRRTLAIILWAMSYIAFSAICPWIANGLRDWQTLSWVTSLPLVFVVLFMKFIPESASWLLMKGRNNEAISYLKQVAKVNGRTIPDDINFTVEETRGKSVAFYDLFKTPRIRKRTFLLLIIWFVTYCCYHTNVYSTGKLHTNVYLSYTYGALVEIPALLLVFFGLEVLGRRWPMIISTTLAGISGILAISVLESPEYVLYFILAQRVTITTEYNIIMQYSSEVYPTVLRGRGLAFLRFTGTLGLYLSPPIVSLSEKNTAYPIVVTGAMVSVLCILSLFLPETLGKNLPHTIADGENFGSEQKILDCPCLNLKTEMVEKETVRL